MPELTPGNRRIGDTGTTEIPSPGSSYAPHTVARPARSHVPCCLWRRFRFRLNANRSGGRYHHRKPHGLNRLSAHAYFRIRDNYPDRRGDNSRFADRDACSGDGNRSARHGHESPGGEHACAHPHPSNPDASASLGQSAKRIRRGNRLRSLLLEPGSRDDRSRRDRHLVLERTRPAPQRLRY